MTGTALADQAFSGTVKIDTAIIETAIVETLRSIHNIWSITTVRNETTLETEGDFVYDIDGVLTLGADSVKIDGFFALLDALIDGDLDVTGNGDIGGDLDIMGGLTVAGETALEDSVDLQVSMMGNGFIHVDGYIQTGTNIFADGNLSVGDNAVIDSCLYVNGDSAVFNTSLFLNWLSLAGDGHFWGDCSFDSTATFSGVVHIDSLLTVDGVGSFDSIYARNATVSEILHVDSIETNAINTVDLYVTGSADLGGVTDTIVVGADSIQVINGVITLIF